MTHPVKAPAFKCDACGTGTETAAPGGHCPLCGQDLLAEKWSGHLIPRVEVGPIDNQNLIDRKLSRVFKTFADQDCDTSFTLEDISHGLESLEEHEIPDTLEKADYQVKLVCIGKLQEKIDDLLSDTGGFLALTGALKEALDVSGIPSWYVNKVITHLETAHLADANEGLREQFEAGREYQKNLDHGRMHSDADEEECAAVRASGLNKEPAISADRLDELLGKLQK